LCIKQNPGISIASCHLLVVTHMLNVDEVSQKQNHWLSEVGN